jgi:hypothetical protein
MSDAITEIAEQQALDRHHAATWQWFLRQLPKYGNPMLRATAERIWHEALAELERKSGHCGQVALQSWLEFFEGIENLETDEARLRKQDIAEIACQAMRWWRVHEEASE